MSKQATSIPAEYQGLNRDTKFLKVCICEDVHGGFYMFEKPEAIHIVKEARQKVWANFDAFEKENKQTLLAYHENLFKKPAPKDQSLVETASWCWYKIISLAVDRLPIQARSNTGRVSQILKRDYFLGTSTDDSGIKTPQAKACLRLFKEALEKIGTKSGEPGKEVLTVTEENLRKYIEENASALHTKQEPWRIFQYYRPNLINAKLIRTT